MTSRAHAERKSRGGAQDGVGFEELENVLDEALATAVRRVVDGGVAEGGLQRRKESLCR